MHPKDFLRACSNFMKHERFFFIVAAYFIGIYLRFQIKRGNLEHLISCWDVSNSTADSLLCNQGKYSFVHCNQVSNVSQRYRNKCFGVHLVVLS